MNYKMEFIDKTLDNLLHHKDNEYLFFCSMSSFNHEPVLFTDYTDMISVVDAIDRLSDPNCSLIKVTIEM